MDTRATATLSAHDRRRLAAMLGMLGSASPGERDNAARMAEEFRLQRSMTWDELLGLPPVTYDAPQPVHMRPRATPISFWAGRALVYAIPYRLTVAYATGVAVLICYGIIRD